jgi:hypothetical protein
VFHTQIPTVLRSVINQYSIISVVNTFDGSSFSASESSSHFIATTNSICDCCFQVALSEASFFREQLSSLIFESVFLFRQPSQAQPGSLVFHTQIPTVLRSVINQYSIISVVNTFDGSLFSASESSSHFIATTNSICDCCFQVTLSEASFFANNCHL